MLDDTIELLTEQMTKQYFECKKEGKEVVMTITKTNLYLFCIKLIRLLKEFE